MDNFKNVWSSDLFDRSILKTWEAKESKTFEDRLREKNIKAMEHKAKHLPPEVVKELDQIQKHWK